MRIPSKAKVKTLFNRVANITILFWVIKVISTTVGEAGADFLSHRFGTIAVIATFILLLASIAIQIQFKKYIPWMYWTVIILVAVFGTMFADILHHHGVPLLASTIGFTAALLITFGLWYASEKTLDVQTIHTAKREIFYWVVILFTFALGTAAGDLFAEDFNLGLLNATLVFAAIILAVPLILYLCKLNRIALFWISYILTRPLGASGADLIAKPKARGGYGLGDGVTCLIFLVIIIGLIVYLTLTHKEQMLDEEQVE